MLTNKIYTLNMIHVYPGMGATSAMYNEAWRSLANAKFHDWPKWNGETSLELWAKHLIDEHGILEGDIIIGSSLGGMIACEIANQLELQEIILLGSAIDPKEINSLLAWLKPLAKFAPIEVLQFSGSKVPSEIAAMFSQSNPQFIRAMCQAIFAWQDLKVDIKVSRIHGSNDLVIPCPQNVDHIIAKAGHLIAQGMFRVYKTFKHLLSCEVK